jgi:hypothetical protein
MVTFLPAGVKVGTCAGSGRYHTILTMTTRTGLAGLVTGLIASIITHLILSGSGTLPSAWTALILLADLLIPLTVTCGFVSVKWSKAHQPGRCIALGGVSGLLAGTILFCFQGAAAAGTTYHVTLSTGDLVPVIVNQTIDTFLLLFISSGLAGGIGGWLASSRRWTRRDDFDMTEPQMAMNVSITALPASIVAAGVAAAIFPRLAMLTGNANGLGSLNPATVADRPLEAALLLVLVSHLAVTLVVPHESRQAEHLCGMDEVKMAAFVGIGAAPLLVGLLLVVHPAGFSNLYVLISAAACAVLSLVSVYSLVRLVLPKRASFPPHAEGNRKTEAVLFGSIANSVAWRLVALCIGCGLVMVLPLHVVVIAVLINLNYLVGANMPVSQSAAQILVSGGLMAASCGVLILIYMLYLNMGRWFSRIVRNK